MADSILIFDSGAGGLSILNEIRKLLPGTDIHYLMDTALFPYGEQDDACLQDRIPDLCTRAVVTFAPAAVVLACNTASTLSLAEVRSRIDIPVVGVVPAVRVAANRAREQQEHCVGLLATPATVRRAYTDQLIDDFARDLQVERFGAAGLVNLAEAALCGDDIREELQQLIGPWLSQHPDMKRVVLGCTHYPLLADALQELWPGTDWIDSGEAVARQTVRVYPHLSVYADNSLPDNSLHCPGTVSLHWTGPEEPSGVIRYLNDTGHLKQAERFN